ncbi:MAG: hypothetical protein K0Q79_1792 [Flavipsychrobacter sp.]|jgi:hypothetical protein|nr:hypothetical protein [Flavipsychrobacter sp.]
MNNQTSIKYISALLDNPNTLTDGDQSSISLFRQTFPYFVPARYLVALESHKKSAYTPQMLTGIQPYLGDWMLFCDFLEASKKTMSDLSTVNKVVDKKKVDIQPEPLPQAPAAPEPIAVVQTPVVAEPALPKEEIKPVQPEIILASSPSVPEPMAPQEEKPVRHEMKMLVEQPASQVIVEQVISAAEPSAPAEVVQEEKWPADTQADAPVFAPPAPQVSAAVDEPLIHDMPVAFIVETPPPPPLPQVEVAPVPEAMSEPPAPQELYMPHIISVPVETVFDSIPLAPTAVVIDEADKIVETEEVEEATAEAAETEVTAEPVAVTEDIIFPQDPETIEETIGNTIEESDFARAWAEKEALVVDPVVINAEAALEPEIIDEAEPAISVTETDKDEEDHDPLIFPIYTKDYFLQQGEKVSEEIPLEINELKDAAYLEDEDKSLMVVMSFSEWLLHFKNTSEKQIEESKDQKALKTMWQKEKLAAAMEEENEEIPETVFEMAVNSISKEEGLVSESLADIYIKQGKYDKAIEMYRKLSLRNPQKSAYFAHKIDEALKDKQS